MRPNVRLVFALYRRFNSTYSLNRPTDAKVPTTPSVKSRNKPTADLDPKWRRGKLENLVKRPPIVTIMGHVDHGKTTLLDNLRNSQIVKQEFGGITQHIGAFVVPFLNKANNKIRELVTFLDTPGHAAFAAMRQRGANITDIVVLVIACEDGVLDQTVESINYAKSSNVPIIVALNKVDKFADERELRKRVEFIRSQLIVNDVISEADGGEVQIVKISALRGSGIEDLKEAILALSETLELKADIDCPAAGHIIESSIDPHRGKLCTVLVERGQIVKGSYLVAGTSSWCKVRALFDERKQLQQACTPGMPIQVIGWREDVLPSAGDPIMQVDSEQEAKSIIHKFQQERTMKKAEVDANLAAERYEKFYSIYKQKLMEKRESGRKYGRILFNPRGQRPKEAQEDESIDRKINLVLKCDVDGSLDAMLDILDTYDKDNKQQVKLDLMHYGVGPINDNDYRLAATFPNSVIYGFNVKFTNQKILVDAKRAGVDVKLFNVIYHLIDDLKLRLNEKIPQVETETELGRALVMQEFIVTESKKIKTRVAGCRCTRGLLRRSECFYKLLRDNQEVLAQDMQVKTLKHLKDDVNEVEKERECGISFLENQSIEFKPGDILVCYEKKKVKPKLKWDIQGFT